MTVNATGGPLSPCGTPLERVGHGTYRLAGASAAAAAPPITLTTGTARTSPREGVVVLVGCVKAKRQSAAPAKDLFTSPLFGRRRRYAERSGHRWFLVSSRWGLVHPDEVIAPYDLYLGDRSREYRQAWGAFVVELLTLAVGPLKGVVAELHAGDDHRSALEPPLRQAGAVPVNPLTATSMGATLAWYDHHDPAPVVSRQPAGDRPVGHKTAT
jgi:hypothetical protein